MTPIVKFVDMDVLVTRARETDNVTHLHTHHRRRRLRQVLLVPAVMMVLMAAAAPAGALGITGSKGSGHLARTGAITKLRVHVRRHGVVRFQEFGRKVG
jgi:hypothetical protein